MGARRFRKRAAVIEAELYDGSKVSIAKILRFGGNSIMLYEDYIKIKTWEGVMRADIGDWIIKGVKGELYPVKGDIFEATYEEVKEIEGGKDDTCMATNSTRRDDGGGGD